PPCQKQACDIQACLQKHNYQESHCQQYLEKLRQCCATLLAKGGSSPCCSKKIAGQST
ncbi:hypothetical protein BJ085DRAFT_15465, partial [Dimargaris cristalligena]